jgi:hypothetical protein
VVLAAFVRLPCTDEERSAIDVSVSFEGKRRESALPWKQLSLDQRFVLELAALGLWGLDEDVATPGQFATRRKCGLFLMKKRSAIREANRDRKALRDALCSKMPEIDAHNEKAAVIWKADAQLGFQLSPLYSAKVDHAREMIRAGAIGEDSEALSPCGGIGALHSPGTELAGQSIDIELDG